MLYTRRKESRLIVPIRNIQISDIHQTFINSYKKVFNKKLHRKYDNKHYSFQFKDSTYLVSLVRVHEYIGLNHLSEGNNDTQRKQCK
jgi:hypothetical protein